MSLYNENWIHQSLKREQSKIVKSNEQETKYIHNKAISLTMFDNFHKIPQMWQDSTTHQYGDLLYNFDTSVSCLP